MCESQFFSTVDLVTEPKGALFPSLLLSPEPAMCVSDTHLHSLPFLSLFYDF